MHSHGCESTLHWVHAAVPFLSLWIWNIWIHHKFSNQTVVCLDATLVLPFIGGKGFIPMTDCAIIGLSVYLFFFSDFKRTFWLEPSFTLVKLVWSCSLQSVLELGAISHRECAFFREFTITFELFSSLIFFCFISIIIKYIDNFKNQFAEISFSNDYYIKQMLQSHRFVWINWTCVANLILLYKFLRINIALHLNNYLYNW